MGSQQSTPAQQKTIRHAVLWEYMDPASTRWVAYPPKQQDEINSHYTTTQNPDTVTLTSETLIIDFSEMWERNPKGVFRPVRGDSGKLVRQVPQVINKKPNASSQSSSSTVVVDDPITMWEYLPPTTTEGRPNYRWQGYDVKSQDDIENRFKGKAIPTILVETPEGPSQIDFRTMWHITCVTHKEGVSNSIVTKKMFCPVRRRMLPQQKGGNFFSRMINFRNPEFYFAIVFVIAASQVVLYETSRRKHNQEREVWEKEMRRHQRQRTRAEEYDPDATYVHESWINLKRSVSRMFH
eukprot:PhF_6_TR26546/c0_g1_i1/m.38371